MNTWFISDLHFFHFKVIEYSKRPFDSLEVMHETLINRWNSKVHDNDLVYVIGDLTLGKFVDMLPLALRLRGKKILIRGNHDKFSHAQYLKLGFTEVFQEAVIKIGKTSVRLSHYPYKPSLWRRLWLPKKAKRYFDRRPPDTGILLHGHTHSPHRVKGRSIHVGVDCRGFYPVSASQIESEIHSILRLKP